ncbi:MAG: hypothetical protein HY536_00760 [Candidatus Colwellbacteria bacterium]|nr:hypothetical protein [Candidatus Colwellbacteria bacterium]
MPIKLIIGLGNPEPRYANTYHNVGASFAERLSVNLPDELRGTAVRVSKAHMNTSGAAVAAAVRGAGATPDQTLVVHDDSDIGLGSYKLSFGRGSAGHHGIEDIMAALGSDRFWRLRIGVRGAGNTARAESFVLTKISPQDHEKLEALFVSLARDLPRLLRGLPPTDLSYIG